MISKQSSTGLHPSLKIPLVAPPNWHDLAVLVSERLHLGFSRADISTALAKDYALVGRRERGLIPITPRAIAEYRLALDQLIAAKAALGAQKPMSRGSI